MGFFNEELVEHFINVLVFAFIAVYIIARRRIISRRNQRVATVFSLSVGVMLVLVSLNLFRVIFELSYGPENQATTLINTLAVYGGTIGETSIILYLLGSKIIVERKHRAGRVLAIGAHPDDIEIAAGGALAKMRDAGYTIHGVVISQGEKGGHAELRIDEAARGASFLEIPDLRLLDFYDTQMSDQAAEITSAIEGIIGEVQPDIIFTHSRHDLHQDHQAVHEATLRAARNCRTTILCYESPSVTQEFNPVYFIDVCGYVDVKIEAINQHWDQRNKTYMRPDLVRGKLIFRGNQAKTEYAEGFEVMRMVSTI